MSGIAVEDGTAHFTSIVKVSVSINAPARLVMCTLTVCYPIVFTSTVIFPVDESTYNQVPPEYADPSLFYKVYVSTQNARSVVEYTVPSVVTVVIAA